MDLWVSELQRWSDDDQMVRDREQASPQSNKVKRKDSPAPKDRLHSAKAAINFGALLQKVT